MEFRIISLAPAESLDGPVRKRGHLASRLESLCASFLYWCQSRGLRLVPSESYSCYHRIRLARRRGLDTRGLVFAEVQKSLPTVTFPRNCSETRSYILSIQALEKVRPYLTIADHEIFAQAWFQAGQFYSCSSYTRSRTKELDSCDTSAGSARNSSSQRANQQPSKHGPSDPLPSRGADDSEHKF
jgi:hypothetical protein